MYKKVLLPILFLIDPEKVHNFTFFLIKYLFKIPFLKFIIKNIYCSSNKNFEKILFGLTFKNPVGLAAGFDKNAELYNELSCFGFGFIEIGTVTPKPQDGNPKKRLFRLKEDSGIINRMGFNNLGVDKIVKNLKKNKNVLIGGNIGKNKITANNKNSVPKPILLKIAPDLNDNQLLDIISIVEDTNLDGLIATNTTVDRSNLISKNKSELGGLSGKPLGNRSTEVIKFICNNRSKYFPIIGVGGICSVKDALEKIDAGADLLQIYSGFIYEGPKLIRSINNAILSK